MADYGGGKHIWDPMLQDMNNLRNYMRYLWLGQLLNLYGMALVKLSICAYIFMLNFSKSFRILIWVSVVVHIGLNFVFPTVILFGECTPYSKHWDVTGTQPGSCWSTTPKVVSGMRYRTATGTGPFNTSHRLHWRCNQYCDRSHIHPRASIISPPRQTQRSHSLGSSDCVSSGPDVGERHLFKPTATDTVHSTTTISALKLYEMKSLNSSPDPTYTSVNLSIYATAEVFVGVITACLPPLRKTFDQVLRNMLPNGMISSRTTQTRDSYALQKITNPSSHVNKKSTAGHESDGDSDYAILEENALKAHGSNDEIIKTTQVTVTLDDKGSERVRKDDWV
jgi:hypothetical protein